MSQDQTHRHHRQISSPRRQLYHLSSDFHQTSTETSFWCYGHIARSNSSPPPCFRQISSPCHNFTIYRLISIKLRQRLLFGVIDISQGQTHRHHRQISSPCHNFTIYRLISIKLRQRLLFGVMDMSQGQTHRHQLVFAKFRRHAIISLFLVRFA
ncbi:hypothetical protein Fcan01_13150 [Folsomia candida]|uniref:Uncharacterized protein n=1 Tax=Folsomia candida TaxID=158441 RepID=A0A226E4S1_FOLCA|nr:hypothetical protein Fcan01_13150 [Folsomia candida]